MKSIWKYEIKPGEHEYHLPYDAELLCAKEQHGGIYVWAMVYSDKADNTRPRRIAAVGTGHPLHDSPMKHLDTANLEGGALIIHVFEVLSDA